ncbi:MAG: CBS domain-containing protein [Methanomassiliicoccus sp.]|nr:CBS domain-containing protein [Methanomassiliicoccus sp.]
MMENTEHVTEARVMDLMRPDPATVPYEGTLNDALEAMIERDSGSVLVMDDGRLAGLIGDTDIARLVVRGVDLKRALVRDFVTACILTGNQPCVQIRRDDSVTNALRVMDSWAANQIVVVNEKDEVVGTISVLDALKGWKKEV